MKWLLARLFNRYTTAASVPSGFAAYELLNKGLEANDYGLITAGVCGLVATVALMLAKDK